MGTEQSQPGTATTRNSRMASTRASREGAGVCSLSHRNIPALGSDHEARPCRCLARARSKARHRSRMVACRAVT
eukprot:scaffold193976_cov30-Tisochrysis_lutea.AAC.1